MAKAALIDAFVDAELRGRRLPGVGLGPTAFVPRVSIGIAQSTDLLLDQVEATWRRAIGGSS